MTNKEIHEYECDIEIVKELLDSTLSDYKEMLNGEIPMDREALLTKLGDAVTGAKIVYDMFDEETA